MGTSIFDNTAPEFTTSFLEDKFGFTTPTWFGYPSEVTQLAPEIQVEQLTFPLLEDGKSKTRFGAVAANGAKKEKIFTVKNIGLARLTGLKVRIDGENAKDFKIIDPRKSSLSIDGSTTFKVAFKPTETGRRHADLHITGEDVIGGPFDVKLSGVGVKP